MRISAFRPLAMAAFAVAVFTGPACADAPDPAVATVQNFYDTLLDTMKHGSELGMKGRYDKLKPAVEQDFDLHDMIALAAGSSWSTMSPSDQQKLQDAFERMTIANYAKNFDSFDNQKFVVDPKPVPRGADKVVQSKLVMPGQTVSFGYRMRNVGGSWKILDIYLTGTISQLAVQRSEYGATIAAGGASLLTKKLNEQADRLMGG